jgi:hypothetical protein
MEFTKSLWPHTYARIRALVPAAIFFLDREVGDLSRALSMHSKHLQSRELQFSSYVDSGPPPVFALLARGSQQLILSFLLFGSSRRMLPVDGKRMCTRACTPRLLGFSEVRAAKRGAKPFFELTREDHLPNFNNRARAASGLLCGFRAKLVAAL